MRWPQNKMLASKWDWRQNEINLKMKLSSKWEWSQNEIDLKIRLTSNWDWPQKDVEVIDEEIVELVVDLNEEWLKWLNREDKLGDWGTTLGKDFLYFLEAQYCANFCGKADNMVIFNWDTIVGNSK